MHNWFDSHIRQNLQEASAALELEMAHKRPHLSVWETSYYRQYNLQLHLDLNLN